jgi:hypothetical protein
MKISDLSIKQLIECETQAEQMANEVWNKLLLGETNVLTFAFICNLIELFIVNEDEIYITSFEDILKDIRRRHKDG